MCRCRSMPRISTAGSICSRQQRAKSVRPRRKRISSSGRGGSRRASNSASPTGRASCSASASDFGATKQEQRDDEPGAYRDAEGSDQSLFRKQPRADADDRVGAYVRRNDGGAGLELSSSVIARSKATKQSRLPCWLWIASLWSQ